MKTIEISIAVCLFIILTWLQPGASCNAQDARVGNFRMVSEGIYAGARPGKQGIDYLRELRIKTIIDLEDGGSNESDDVQSERQQAEADGIRFVSVPMNPVFAPKVSEVEEALRYIEAVGNRPVFVHCFRGSDRTGAVIAAWRITNEGWTIDDAYAEMMKYGHRNILMFWWKDVLYKFAPSINPSHAVPDKTVGGASGS